MDWRVIERKFRFERPKVRETEKELGSPDWKWSRVRETNFREAENKLGPTRPNIDLGQPNRKWILVRKTSG